MARAITDCGWQTGKGRAGMKDLRTHRLRSMVLTVVAWKFPFESGPKSTASPALMDPELMIPSTTVPTYGTEYTSVIEYSNG